MIDISGQKFGRLTAKYPIHKNGKIYWVCDCDCGTKNYEVSASSLRSGNTCSCGCIHKELLIERNEKTAKWNGQSNNEYKRLYNIYNAMIGRCNNPKNKKYQNYGGRNIKVCNEWLNDYILFKDWALMNGYNDTLTIDRIDSNGNYEPNNCHWVDMKTQANNKCNNKNLTYKGRTQTLAQWCGELNLNYSRTKARLNTCHMTIEQAFELPYQRLRRKINIEV